MGRTRYEELLYQNNNIGRLTISIKMSSSFVSFLNKYDIFGKSIPGAVLITGGYLLLPNQIEFVFRPPKSAFELIGLVFSVLVLGLLIGEAIHTLSRLVEGIFITIGLRLVPSLRKIKVRLIGFGAYIRIFSYNNFRNQSEESDQNNEPKLRRKRSLITLRFLSERLALLIELPAQIGERVFEFLYPAFQRHRILFQSWLRSNYTSNPDHWDPGNQGILSEEFEKICEDEFDIDLQQNPSTGSLYTIVAARVGQSGNVLSQRFQDLYSFSRSMWVVLLLLSIWYALVFIFGKYLPWWHSSVSYSQIILIFITMVGFLSLFLLAAGRYKQAYVEYLISDFVSIQKRELFP